MPTPVRAQQRELCDRLLAAEACVFDGEIDCERESTGVQLKPNKQNGGGDRVRGGGDGRHWMEGGWTLREHKDAYK